jgi:hypothetical protein
VAVIRPSAAPPEVGLIRQIALRKLLGFTDRQWHHWSRNGYLPHALTPGSGYTVFFTKQEAADIRKRVRRVNKLLAELRNYGFTVFDGGRNQLAYERQRQAEVVDD